MSSDTATMRVNLKPCPFCGEAPFVRNGLNGYAHCRTPGCWANRCQTVSLEDQAQVSAWNLRDIFSPDIREPRLPDRSMLARILYDVMMRPSLNEDDSGRTVPTPPFEVGLSAEWQGRYLEYADSILALLQGDRPHDL